MNVEVNRVSATKFARDFKPGQTFGHGTLNGKPMWVMVLDQNSPNIDVERHCNQQLVVQLDNGHMRYVLMQDAVVCPQSVKMDVAYYDERRSCGRDT